MCVREYVSVVCNYICVNVRVCVCIYVCIYVYVCECERIFIYMGVYTLVHVYCLCVHIYLCARVSV